MKKWFAMLLACLLTVGMMTGCGQGSDDGSTEDRTLRIASGYDVSGLYPYKMQATQADGLFGSLIYDTLVRISGDDRHEEMDLAESYEYNDEKTELTFHLRKGVKFHTGTEMKASDVVFSYNHFCEENYTGPFSGVKGVRATDDYTVVFDLEYAYGATVPNEVQMFYVISEEYFEEVGGAEEYAEAPVGTGPYKFVSWEKNANVQLEAFEDNYMGAPAIKKVEVQFMTDSSARANALEAGDVDYAEIDSTSLNIFEGNDEFNVAMIETPACNGPLFNMSVKEFQDKKVRQAIAYAIDREQMTKAVYPDGGAEATSIWMPEAQKGYTSDVPEYTYDLDKAKALMKEAGYADGFDAGQIMCNSLGAKPAQVLQAQLEKIGITTTIQTLETAAYYDSLFKQDYTIAFMNFGPEVAHVADTSKLFSTDGELNFMGYSNKELDKLYAQLAEEVNDDKVMELSKEISTIIQEEAPWIKCFARNNIIVMSSGLDGFEPVDMGVNMYTLKWN